MNCPLQTGNPDVLLDYSARNLASGVEERLVQHVAACPDCTRFVADQDQLWKALDAWDAPPVSDDFDQKLYARIEAADSRSLVHRLFGDSFSWKPTVSFAGALATVVVVLFLVAPNDRGKQSVTPRANHDASHIELDAEQVERTLEDLEMLRQLEMGSTGGNAHAPQTQNE